ncbi:mitochondrial fusion and transport protein Ugo1p [[Candida] railenensis]|uniref:Mitochondrial fusion and transport protein Ugo1p n=1 Tax=[Candida] railenensis TaxID=45579 RepID=A0A9P0QVE3_9ASCO|nr:mitochondrial fusion and transport protein Ugo1p [[Candida] railenensis]
MSDKLRPYYDRDTFNAGYSVFFKPGVGLIDTETGKPLTASLASNLAQQSAKKSFKSVNGIGLSGFGGALGGGSNGSGDKNFVYDLEIQEYFDSNNFSELLKNLAWSFIKNYCRALVSQPLEIVRLVLQVGYFQNLDSKSKGIKAKKRKSKRTPYSRLVNESIHNEGYTTTSTNEEEEGEIYTTEEDREDEGEINYFQSISTNSPLKPNAAGSSGANPPEKKSFRSKQINLYKIQPISKHTVDIMSAIVAKDGPFALFRGINATFIYQTISHTIEAWITGFMSPFLGIPDPFFLDLTHSTDPWKSLWLSVSACVLTGIILMPLDLIKIRLMITQFNRPTPPPTPLPTSSPIVSTGSTTASTTNNSSDEDDLENIGINTPVNTRSIRESIRNYPLSLLIHPPGTITCLTVLYQFSTTIFRKAAPYILFIKFNVDSYSSPTVYTLVNLFSLIMEFFVKLPVENLLRKEQVRFLLKPKSELEDAKKVVSIEDPDKDLIVEFNDGWRGDKGTEGGEDTENTVGLIERIERLGLFDGWRVGVLNVIGFWGYNIIKSNGIDLQEERF